jgi:hypothetical protein
MKNRAVINRLIGRAVVTFFKLTFLASVAI